MFAALHKYYDNIVRVGCTEPRARDSQLRKPMALFIVSVLPPIIIAVRRLAIRCKSRVGRQTDPLIWPGRRVVIASGALRTVEQCGACARISGLLRRQA